MNEFISINVNGKNTSHELYWQKYGFLAMFSQHHLLTVLLAQRQLSNSSVFHMFLNPGF